MDDSSASDFQWGSYESIMPITSPDSLITPHHDSIEQEIDTKVSTFVADSSISNIQWGSIDFANLATLDVGFEMEVASTSSIDQPCEASKEQIEVNDITFPGKYFM